MGKRRKVRGRKKGSLLFVGGHDANFVRSDEMAWVFQISMKRALNRKYRP